MDSHSSQNAKMFASFVAGVEARVIALLRLSSFVNDCPFTMSLKNKKQMHAKKLLNRIVLVLLVKYLVVEF